MSRTADPHPASYFAFACLVTETAEYLDVLLPWSLPPETWTLMADELPASFVRYHTRDHELLKSELQERELATLAKMGVPADRLGDVTICDYVARKVCDRLFVLFDGDRRKPLLEVRLDEDGNYVPRRETVRKIVTGEHFAHSEGNRAQTARSLNAGMPARDRGYGVTDTNIRDALNGFALRHARYVDDWCSLITSEVRRAGILTRLWLHYRGVAPRPRVSNLLWQIENGDLLDEYGRLLNETPLIPSLTPHKRREALALGRDPIIAEARKNMALYLARGGDRAAIPEPLRFLVSQSA